LKEVSDLQASLEYIQGDVNIFVYSAETFDEPCLVREDGVELDKVGAATDVYLFCINAFTIPAIELVGIAPVEDFFVTGQYSVSHVVGSYAGRKTASKAIRTRLDIELAAWKGRGVLLTQSDRVTVAGRHALRMRLKETCSATAAA
jgi:hypothetical protein